MNGRFIKWKEAVSLTSFSPIVGVGGGNYILAVEMLSTNKLELFTSRSTNTYLQVLVEKGLLGFVVYGNMICMILYTVIKNKYHEKWIIILFFSSFISLLIREISFSSFFEKDIFQLLIVIMILVMFQPIKNKI
nr:O-antigen ligase family protein [uncultured Parabacteroides sp.]